MIPRKGHRYLTVVVDQNTRRLVWAATGRDKATLSMFFDELGPQRCAAITHVSADAADWTADVVAVRCPGAVQCADASYYRTSHSSRSSAASGATSSMNLRERG
jgi:transposase